MALTSTRQAVREEAADFLSLLIRGTASAVDPGLKQVTIAELVKKVPNTEWLTHAFVTADGSDFARITTQPTTAGVVTLTSIPTGMSNGVSVRIYILLDPEEWNDILDRTMSSELYRRKVYTTPIVSSQNEYALPTGVQSRADIIDIHLRDASTTVVIQEEAGVVRIREDDHVVTVLLGSWPLAGTVELYVEYKERYAEMANDSTTTTCPFDLAWSTIAVNAVDKIRSKYGAAYAEKLQAQLNGALRKSLQLKQQHMPPIVARDYIWDAPMAIDIPSVIYDGHGW